MDRIHIGIFGNRNSGKSTLINAITGQDIAIVSEIKGTTTDPVQKTMELLPLGPVMIIDTPGLDDEGDLGKLRIGKTLNILNKTDIGILVIDAETGITRTDEKLIELFSEKRINFLLVFNKIDSEKAKIQSIKLPYPAISVSAKTGENIEKLKNLLPRLKPNKPEGFLVADLLKPQDTIVLVTPIDQGAPKGRIILPQQQVLRELLDKHCSIVVTQPEELLQSIENLKQTPRLVITDSQAFQKVNSLLPKEIPLTSFSILFARYKGNLAQAVRGIKALENIQDGDQILIGEGCTHHRQCGDIGTEKLPAWIKEYTGKEPKFTFTAGGDFPLDLKKYKLIIQCGGCMLTEREMQYRYKTAADAKVPMTNYGITIAYIKGILDRVVAPFNLA